MKSTTMTCEICGTIVRYGKRVKTGRKLCLDCWKLKDSKKPTKGAKSGNETPKRN